MRLDRGDLDVDAGQMCLITEYIKGGLGELKRADFREAPALPMAGMLSVPNRALDRLIWHYRSSFV